MALINLKPQIRNKLNEISSIGRRVFPQYPDSFNTLPCISYYEITNADRESADDKAYNAFIEFMVDVWGSGPEDIEPAASLVDDKMKELGFWRTFARDDYDDENKRVKVKNMRYSITKEV